MSRRQEIPSLSSVPMGSWDLPAGTPKGSYALGILGWSPWLAPAPSTWLLAPGQPLLTLDHLPLFL